MTTLITLHGALLGPSSMLPISKALLRYLPISQQVHLELPGHGCRPLETGTALSIDDMAGDVLRQIDLSDVGIQWENSILVGESTGALVLAAAASQINATPLAGLYGEPPLSNGYGMRQVRSSLEATNTNTALALQQVFGWQQNQNRDFRYIFSKPDYPSVIVHGLQTEKNDSVTVHSVIEKQEIDSLIPHENLTICAVSGAGHRVLQKHCFELAILLKGILIGKKIINKASYVLFNS